MTNERARTSESHPIRVDFFDRGTLDLPGRLGMTFLPGMNGTSARGGPWERDLDSDLRRLKGHYGVAALVPLLRDEEFEEYGVPDLLAAAEREGMDVLHFPITDVSVPEEAEDDAYAALIEEILGLLERGENVVAHCRGGLGRTGVVAASVLVARGYGADEAIGRTRRARRDTVETAGQVDYVRRFEGRWRRRRGGREEPPQVQRYRGSLLGLAAGDALGTTVEFSRPGTFDPVEDIVGGGPFRLEPGQWTDDTSMALCLAESLVEKGGFDPADQLGRYVRWYRDGHMSSTGECFDIGNATREALERFEKTGDPYPGAPDPNRAGNGSLMRLAPVPLFYGRGPLGLAEERRPVAAIERCGESSRTTHGAENCVDACRYFGALIVGAINGASKEDLLFPNYCPVGGYWDHFPLSEEVARVARGSFKEKEPPEIRGKTYVVDSLEAALWAFHKSDSFEEGALLVVNLGRDADSTGAIYGQLAGALYGEDAIPASWRSKLAMRKEIEGLAEELFRTGETVDWDGLLDSVPDVERSDPTEVASYLLPAFYEHGIVFVFAWQDFHEAAERLFEDSGELASADESDIRRLLTFHARRERFAEGHFEEMVESGHIAAVMGRARELAARTRRRG